jgi:TRAP-type C4-dicarboxylate transport system permease small subunit
MKKSLRWLAEHIFIVVAVALLAISSFMVTTEVFFRYVINAPHDWSDNVNLIICLFTVFLASGAVVNEGDHVAVTTLFQMTKGKLRKALDIFNNICELVFCSVLFWFGFQYVLFAIKIDIREPTSLNTPSWIAFMAIPLGMAISLYYIIRKLVRIFRGKKQEAGAPQITM